MTSPPHPVTGAWRVASAAEPAADRYGPHALWFSAHGELIQTDLTDEGPQRCLLTWREQDGLLHLDQPSHPHEEQLAWALEGAQRLRLGDSWYERETGSHRMDADAEWWALLAAGLWHGLANAGPEPFVPFLLLDDGPHRVLTRVVARDARSADAHAAAQVRQTRFDRALWVRDGYLYSAEAREDAVLASRFEPGGVGGPTHALRFRLEGGRARAFGGLETLPG